MAVAALAMRRPEGVPDRSLLQPLPHNSVLHDAGVGGVGSSTAHRSSSSGGGGRPACGSSTASLDPGSSPAPALNPESSNAPAFAPGGATTAARRRLADDELSDDDPIVEIVRESGPPRPGPSLVDADGQVEHADGLGGRCDVDDPRALVLPGCPEELPLSERVWLRAQEMIAESQAAAAAAAAGGRRVEGGFVVRSQPQVKAARPWSWP